MTKPNDKAPLMGINVASDRKAGLRYADLIVDGHKTLESRNGDTLRPYVGKRVAIVRTGEGSAKAIGEVTVGQPIVVNKKKFRSMEDQHLVPKGSAFDITTPTKHLYPMHDPVRYEKEKDVGHGIIARKVINMSKGGLPHMSGGGSMNPKYPSIQEMIQKLQEAGRTPIVPAPNRWFADPVKHPFQQKMIERVLAQTKQGREGFPSGSYINPQTGEPMDFDIMHDLGVAIDPNTGRPMMSGIKSDLTEIDPKYGSVTKSNLVRKGLFKHEGGDELLKNLAFLATIEKSGKGHHYGLSTHYASPAELVNTMTGKNPTLRPHSRGDIFGVGDEVGRISIQGKHHPVYEKLLVAPAGSDVQGKKLHKAKGGDVNKAKFLAKSKIKERLYHGTTKDFGLFSHKHQYSGEGGSHSGSGFYFTDNPESASRYSMMRGESGSNVMPVHLNIKKPLHFDWEQGETTGAKLKLTPTQVRSIMLSHPKIKDEDESPLTNWGDIRGASFNKTLNDAVNSYAGSSMLAALRNDFFGDNHEQWLRALHKATGYDSGTTVTPNGERHYIAWFPEQIKSAIGNRGTYDTTDPDITKKLGGRVTHAHHLEIEERPL